MHVRGFTKADSQLPECQRGTYAGLIARLPYLTALGVTANELMPCQAFANAQNDDGDPRGDNYWGYMTLAYGAPNRRYAADQGPGGPTREFQHMVDACHEAGIKVYLDVVYNHTAEGILSRSSEENHSRLDDAQHDPDRAALLSWRGIDNAGYYALRSRTDLDDGQEHQRYHDVSACGACFDFAAQDANNMAADLVIDTLCYWRDVLGVDGFRFDLAPALGWQHDRNAFNAAAPLLNRIADTLPNVDLIAEPWTATGGYCLGGFPTGWAEWNDVARERLGMAADRNRLIELQPWIVADVVTGSAQSFSGDRVASGLARAWRDPAPWCSVNYLCSHDGLTLRDLLHAREHNVSTAVTIAGSLLVVVGLAGGVPMLQAGDECWRTQDGLHNAVAEDSPRTWLQWLSDSSHEGADNNAYNDVKYADHLRRLTTAVLQVRRGCSLLQRSAYFLGGPVIDQHGAAGFPDVSWWRADGAGLIDRDWHDQQAQFLLWRLCPPNQPAVCVARNWSQTEREYILPPARPGNSWDLMVSSALRDQPFLESDGRGRPAAHAALTPPALPAHAAAVWREVADSTVT